MTSISSFGAACLACMFALSVAHAADDMRWCRPTVPLYGYPPVLQMTGAEAYGSDRAAEPFVLAVMQAAAAWSGNKDEAAAKAIIEQMRRWAQPGALARTVEVGEDASNTNSIYSLRRALVALLAAWSDLSAAAAPSDRRAIDDWLAQLVARQDINTGGAKTRDVKPPVSNRNNHAYLRATVDALWAVKTNDARSYDRAVHTVQAALDGMRVDGSLPLETARGARALWYQRHAIASLVYIGEILAERGYDIWQPRGDGHTLHDAVTFLAAAVRDPAKVDQYAGENRNPKPGSDPSRQDLGFLEPRGNGRHYMAWVEYYRNRFPDRAAKAGLDELIRPSLEMARPLIDELAGGNTTCKFSSARRKNGTDQYRVN